MSSLALAAIVFACSFGAAIAGLRLHKMLPARHLDPDSRDVIKLVMGLIGTISALVLGLLIASANNSYNAQSGELEALSVDVVLLDRLLFAYGPDATVARSTLREAIVSAHDRIWMGNTTRPGNLDVATVVVEQVQRLRPADDAQRLLLGQALQVSEDILRTRLMMFEQRGRSTSWPFLVVLVFWISMLFLGFGVFTRMHTTITVTLLVGALSVAGAIFLIAELSDPYHGFLQMSDAPLRNAIAQISH